MHGRGDERQEPWLLIKERDDEARPAAEYSVVDAEPASVLSDRTIADRRRRRRRPPSARRARRSTERGRARRSRLAKAAASAPAAKPPPAARRSRRSRRRPARSRRRCRRRCRRSSRRWSPSRPRDGGWLYEIKFDGYRMLARIDGDDVRLLHAPRQRLDARACRRWSRRCATLGLGSAWLDGEIVVTGANGAPDFNALQNAFDSARTDAHPVLRLRPAVLRRPRPAQRAAGRAPCRARRGCSTRAPPQQRVRFSEDFDASADGAARRTPAGCASKA